MFNLSKKTQIKNHLEIFLRKTYDLTETKNITDSSRFNVLIGITLVMIGILNKNDGPKLNRSLMDDLVVSSQDLVKDLRFKLKDVADESFEFESLSNFYPDLKNIDDVKNMNVNGLVGFKLLYDMRVESVVNRFRNEQDNTPISIGFFIYFSKLNELNNDKDFSSLLSNITELLINLIKLR